MLRPRFGCGGEQGGAPSWLGSPPPRGTNKGPPPGSRAGLAPLQGETSALAASWDPFQDDETGVDSYSYQARLLLQCLFFPFLTFISSALSPMRDPPRACSGLHWRSLVHPGSGQPPPPLPLPRRLLRPAAWTLIPPARPPFPFAGLSVCAWSNWLPRLCWAAGDQQDEGGGWWAGRHAPAA